MLGDLRPQPADKIIEMIALFREDPREGKIDLGVGVFKDASGNTPVMRAVKVGESRLHNAQTTKSYVGLQGDLNFLKAMQGLVLGDDFDMSRVTGAQTPGGTGAIRQLYELIRLAEPNATLWISSPSWPNHAAIARYLGMPHKEYRYFDAATGEIDRDGMMADLSHAGAEDVVLLHGCCHNPTGANLTVEDWSALAELFKKNGVTPFIDLAYQGFGDGLEEDVHGVRLMAREVPEMLIATSCSKNFGLYRDRVGAALIVGNSPEQVELGRVNLASLNRLNYSFPPDHGAAIVATIFSDPKLVAEWKAELETMREQMLEKRVALADALRKATNSDRFDFIAHHRGMFSLTGLSVDEVMKLREEDAIYIVHDGRINVAGIPLDRVDYLATAIARVISE